MITLKEFQDLVQIIQHNQTLSEDQLIYEYGDWFSRDGQTFSLVDDHRDAFEIRDSKLVYLGKSCDALAELIKMAQPLGGPPDFARHFDHYLSQVLADEPTT
jgi:hypothetical protein